MKKKTCIVCGRPVEKGTGTHCQRKLVHKTCKGILQANWHRYI